MHAVMDGRKVVINKRVKTFTRESLEKLDKDDLVGQVLRLQAYNIQLKNLLNKKLSGDGRKDEELQKVFEECFEKISDNRPHPDGGGVPDKPKRWDKKRKFDFTKMNKRHILLKFLYFGWDYEGYAVQEDTHNTIETIIFNALTRTCLIESRQTSNYHRCGRTDKEVSAFSQVISIDIRSKFPENEQLKEESIKNEIEYCNLLNRVLPKDIQCIAWMPLRSELFSARFDCCSRTYRYYFPKSDLDLEKLSEACKLLERHADFRNFCKLDVHNGVTNYMRNIEEASVGLCSEDADSGYSMCYLQIRANAFLWHQIRCIVAVLFLIAKGREESNVIDDLFDIEKNPCKPQYHLAAGTPLNLFQVDYNPNSLSKEDISEATEPDLSEWVYDEENLTKAIEMVQDVWTQNNVRTTMTRDVLNNLEYLLRHNFPMAPAVNTQVHTLLTEFRAKQYLPLLKRRRCDSLESRIEHFIKKQKLLVKDDDGGPSLQVTRDQEMDE